MRVVAVHELTAYLRDLIETDPILADIWVRGEVTHFTRAQSGHIYFTLNDGNAVLHCALFRGSQRGILALPQIGEAVFAHGRVSIYEGTGRYQLYVDQIAPDGAGLLQLQFEELRGRLDREGLFAQERKRPLPDWPKVIGVVTSAQGAVWHDIQTTIARRFPLVELVLAPSAVQGPEAPAQLVRALRALEAEGRCNVVIIGRGGGSPEDLAAFNDEGLARAIYACSVPVVSAVGHESDVTISDFVADLRAPTPTAAAELCVPHRGDVVEAVGARLEQASLVVQAQVSAAWGELNQPVNRLRHNRLEYRLNRHRQDIDRRRAIGSQRLHHRVTALRHRCQLLEARAKLLDPDDVLRRGYAVVSRDTTTGQVRVSRAAEARSAERLRVSFIDGDVLVSVRQENTGR
jgi:exodeoxyribonuclease VII large subunit